MPLPVAWRAWPRHLETPWASVSSRLWSTLFTPTRWYLVVLCRYLWLWTIFCCWIFDGSVKKLCLNILITAMVRQVGYSCLVVWTSVWIHQLATVCEVGHSIGDEPSENNIGNILLICFDLNVARHPSWVLKVIKWTFCIFKVFMTLCLVSICYSRLELAYVMRLWTNSPEYILLHDKLLRDCILENIKFEKQAFSV